LKKHGARLEGELYFDRITRALYATDASEYQEFPLAVAFPRSETDFAALVGFAQRHKVRLIPRTAGTSFAGHVVGAGLVVNIGRHLNRILDIDVVHCRVRGDGALMCLEPF